MPNPKISGHLHNIWSRNIFPFSMEGCVLYDPFWQEDVQGSPFLSYDGNHYSHTATGATWGSQGRTFDAVDDKITFGDTSTLAWMHGKGNTSAFAWTFLTWFNQAHFGTQYAIFLDTNATASANTGIAIYSTITTRKATLLLTQGGAAVCSFGSTAAFTNDTAFHKLAVTYDQSLANTNMKMYIDDNAVETANKTANAPNDANSSYAPIIGNVNAGNLPFDGIIGDYLIFNRALSVAEIQNIYQVTKGRYV